MQATLQPNHQQRAAVRRKLERQKFIEFRNAGNSRSRSKLLARVKVDLMFERGQVYFSGDGGKTKTALAGGGAVVQEHGADRFVDPYSQEDDGA